MAATECDLMQWLLSGDVSVQYQTRRDLLGEPESALGPLRLRIAEEGWGKRFLDLRDNATELWGNGYYSPKWVSTHYTLLDLMNMGFPPSHPAFRGSADVLLGHMWPRQGLVRRGRYQDVCVAAMILSICCHCGMQTECQDEIVDYILERQLPDGGWNCSWQNGTQRSSVHTTLTVLEALRDYAAVHYSYRADEAAGRVAAGQEFLLRKRLFRSERTGEIFDNKMLKLSYPSRWKYDILRCLDYFRSVGLAYDVRMDEALDIVAGKMKKNGRWPVQQKYSGLTHFDMEKTGGDSRWNTLRALRVMKLYRPELYAQVTCRRVETL